MSKRNSRAAKVRRRNERAARETGSHDETPFPAYLESDEAYLEYVLHAPDAELTGQQRQLRQEIRAHHPELLPDPPGPVPRLIQVTASWPR